MELSSTKDIKLKVGAPSKCLATGGYLVLKPPNEGIVIALDCYFWTEVVATENDGLSIAISCPQIN